MSILPKILGHPLTHGLSVDDPRTTLLRRNIIQEKVFLRAISNGMRRCQRSDKERQRTLPQLITSEVIEIPADSPLQGQSLHHTPDVTRFFLEAARCIRQVEKL